MAGSGEAEIVGKPVQELALNLENVPKDYMHEEGGVGFCDALLPSHDDDIPVLDLHRFSSPSELAKLRHALSSWGCFQAINHGMDSWFLDKVRQVSKQFFQLPKEEKQKCAREPNHIEGYGNDAIYFENQRLDWTDRVYIKVLPEDQRNFKFWPQNPNDFRSIVLQYTESIQLVIEVILKAMAKSLNLEENCFLNECGENERRIMDLRFNYYPQCPMPNHVLGQKPHADGSAITFVLQDKEVEGLQVLRDDKWFKVPIIPDALVINVGDQIEIMSNGIFRSPIHRAVINSEKERLTLAMFLSPDAENEIKPVDKLVNESRPILYRPVKNYSEIFFQYYQQGKRSIETSKI